MDAFNATSARDPRRRPTHPIEPGPRRDKWEAAKPITIGDNVWLGSGVIVLPGVSIGENTVVGAGSVVTRDLPADVVAARNPALRTVTQAWIRRSRRALERHFDRPPPARRGRGRPSRRHAVPHDGWPGVGTPRLGCRRCAGWNHD